MTAHVDTVNTVNTINTVKTVDTAKTAKTVKTAKTAKTVKTVDLVVPCYNEGQSLRRFYIETRKETDSIPGYRFHFIFIDDGSTDDTLSIITEFSRTDKDAAFISFSRNFGKEAGIYAGLKHSTGDYTAIIDADLQHPPSMLRAMLKAVDEEGYDSCSARRVSREGEPRIKSFFARLFYRLINRMSEVDIVDGAVDYRLMSRQMVRAILELSEVQRFSKGIFAWVGFKTKWVEFHNVERIAGETKFSFWGLFKYAIEGITAFSTVPLRFASFTGLAISLLSFALMIYELVKTLFFGIDAPGYPSTFIMLLLIGGIMIMSCGILGEYMARMYMETKRRPIYIERLSSYARNECGGDIDEDDGADADEGGGAAGGADADEGRGADGMLVDGVDASAADGMLVDGILVEGADAGEGHGAADGADTDEGRGAVDLNSHYNKTLISDGSI